MRIMLIALALAGGCASTGGTNAGGDPAAAAATAESVATGGERVCRSMTVAGSIRAQRICKTSDEWAEREREGAEGLDEYRRARSAVGGRLPTEGAP